MDEESVQETVENLVSSTVNDETPKQTPSPSSLDENQGPSQQNVEHSNENTEKSDSFEPEPENENELPFESEELQDEEEDVMNSGDISDVEMEIPDHEIGNVSNHSQNDRIIDPINANEEVIVDDDDDDIIVDEVIKKVPYDITPKMRTDKIDSVLSWFVQMKPELIEDCKIFRGDYLTSAINEKNLMLEMETCKKYLESYKTLEDLDDVVEELSLPSVHHALMGICLATLELNNCDNIDFSPLCYDRIDLWAFMEISKWVDLPESGVNYVNGPLELMKMILAPPSFVVLGLTVLWLKENNYPVLIEFMEMETYSCHPAELEDIEKLIMKTTQEFWKENETIHDENARVSESITSVLRDLEATEVAIRADVDRVMQVKAQLQSCKIEDMREQISNMEPPETLDVLTTSEREDLEKLLKSLAEAREMMVKRKQEIAEHRASATNLHEALVLWPGEYCLARADAKDAHSLELARVEAQISDVCYRVNFHHSQVSENVDIRDLAYIKLGMFDTKVSATTYIGLRVACLCKEPNSEEMKWFSGTIAGRAASNGNEFLVFLDRGDDIYLFAPFHSHTQEAIDICKIPTETDDVSVIEMRISMMHMVPMISQSFKESAELDLTEVHKQLRGERDSGRVAFVKRFMEKSPYWPLLRLPIGKILPIYDENLKRNQKTMVTVIHTDRSFCVVRQQQSVSSIGYGCLDYPCVQPGHVHKDESVYRGSYRFPEVYQINGKGTENSNMSKRSLDRIRAQFDSSEATKKMPTKEKFDYEAVHRLDTTITSENKKQDTKMSNAEIAERKKNEANILIRRVETPVLKPLEDLKPHEKCGPECLQMLDSDPYDEKYHQCSPLHIPMMCAWRRYKITLRNSKRRGNRHIIMYYAPCGKQLPTLKAIGKYLRETRSLITIDCFSFEVEIDTDVYVYTEKQFVKDEDYANKLEGMPIPAVNTVDDETPPKIEYTKARYAFEDRVDIATINREFCSGCTCEGNCADSSTCECQQLTAFSYSRLPSALVSMNPKFQGLYENRLLSHKTYSGIYECNSQCSCQRKTCHNRVVQNNIKYPMQLFKTAQSGWGVRALTDIPSGAFLCNYVGALLTNELADALQNEDQYFADLDLKDVVEKEKMLGDTNEYHDFEEDDEDYVDRNNSDYDELENSGVGTGSTGSDEGTSISLEDSNLRRSTRRNALKQREESRKKAEKERQKRKQDAIERRFKWDEYFDDIALYVLDAKKKGNIGRFLNHSCDPNVQVQHVLYDTHDLRLPWVAFFTMKTVKAGEELCWNYHYEVSQEGEEKVRCHCGAKTCRGRLL